MKHNLEGLRYVIFESGDDKALEEIDKLIEELKQRKRIAEGSNDSFKDAIIQIYHDILGEQ